MQRQKFDYLLDSFRSWAAKWEAINGGESVADTVCQEIVGVYVSRYGPDGAIDRLEDLITEVLGKPIAVTYEKPETDRQPTENQPAIAGNDKSQTTHNP